MLNIPQTQRISLEMTPRSTMRERTAMSRDIAGRLHEAIRNSRLLPGERLGSVRHLADSFGVGRQVILSALGLLAEQGLIVTKAKQGCYVNPKLSPGVVKENVKRFGFTSWRVGEPGVNAFSVRAYQAILRSAPEYNCEVFWRSEATPFNVGDWVADMRLDGMFITGLIDDALLAALEKSIPCGM